MKVNRVKTILFLAFALVFFLGGSVGVTAQAYYQKIVAYLDSGIKIKINGKDFKPTDAKGNAIVPISYNGNTYLPLKSVADAVAMPVKWNEKTRTASLGYETIQLNNFTVTSFVNIQIPGGWHPSYITPTKQIYSNAAVGVFFEIRPANGATLDELLDLNKEEMKRYATDMVISSVTKDHLNGKYIEFESSDAHAKTAIFLSDNSDEYYFIQVYAAKSRYNDSEKEMDQIINSFEKQR